MLSSDLARKIDPEILIKLVIIQCGVVEVIDTQRQHFRSVQLLDIFLKRGIYLEVADKSAPS